MILDDGIYKLFIIYSYSVFIVLTNWGRMTYLHLVQCILLQKVIMSLFSLY